MQVGLAGHTDLVVSDSTPVANVGVQVLSNDGKGTLVLTKTVSFAGGATGVATGDLDGDGKPDVVVGLPGSGGIAVLLNRTP